MEDSRLNDFDPDRRQSVASASNIVLQAADGKELGPEADETTKKKLKDQLERAAGRRARERNSDYSHLTKTQNLVKVDEHDGESSEDDKSRDDVGLSHVDINEDEPLSNRKI